ncbi:hypothetical protein LI328DRAFT_155192 [Trichoderma asperelloides]|nr:hypothetical protein LI328DRAFT_155192 [Trichoderma asperelloides]
MQLNGQEFSSKGPKLVVNQSQYGLSLESRNTACFSEETNSRALISDNEDNITLCGGIPICSATFEVQRMALAFEPRGVTRTYWLNVYISPTGGVVISVARMLLVQGATRSATYIQQKRTLLLYPPGRWKYRLTFDEINTRKIQELCGLQQQDVTRLKTETKDVSNLTPQKKSPTLRNG